MMFKTEELKAEAIAKQQEVVNNAHPATLEEEEEKLKDLKGATIIA